ncbi:MAG: hypothetical protein ABI835_02120 [Chloroflexota bacterium]
MKRVIGLLMIAVLALLVVIAAARISVSLQSMPEYDLVQQLFIDSC